MKRRGFTLIEVLTATGLVAITMTVVVIVLAGLSRSVRKQKTLSQIEREGNEVMINLRRSMAGIPLGGVDCGEGVGTSLTVTDEDGDTARMYCDEVASKIASASAGGEVDLTTARVSVIGCATFVSCQTMPESGEVGSVDFGFGLGAGNSAVANEWVEREFRTKVVVR